MSARPQVFAISAERRERARRRLALLVSRRVAPACVLALVDAAVDALAEGRAGAARDLVCCVCSPARAGQGLLELLDEPRVASASTPQGAVG